MKKSKLFSVALFLKDERIIEGIIHADDACGACSMFLSNWAYGEKTSYEKAKQFLKEALAREIA
jgi:hypothetical protein